MQISIGLAIAVTSAMLMTAEVNAAPREVIVDLVVLQKDVQRRDGRGEGNEHWINDNRYTDAVFKMVNDIYGSKEVKFKVVKTRLVSDKYYKMSQKKLLKEGYFRNRRGKGKIVAVVSSEIYDGSSSGRAVDVDAISNPMMIIRSRKNGHDPIGPDYALGTAGITNAAYLFTHELGHMMDLNHKEEVDYLNTVYTENYVYPHKSGPDGRRYYEHYFKNCLAPTGSRSCKKASKRLSGQLLPPYTPAITLAHPELGYPENPEDTVVSRPDPTGPRPRANCEFSRRFDCRADRSDRR